MNTAQPATVSAPATGTSTASAATAGTSQSFSSLFTWPLPARAWQLLGNFFLVVYLVYFWFTEGPLTSRQRWMGRIFYILIFITLAISYCPANSAPSNTSTTSSSSATLATPTQPDLDCTIDYFQRIIAYGLTILSSPMWMALIVILFLGAWFYPSIFTRHLELVTILLFYLYHLGQGDQIPPLPLFA